MLAPTNVRSATAEACAKINLTLEVLGRRDDGYHNLRSLVIGVDLRDRISCCTINGSSPVLDCAVSGLTGSDNLAHKAAVELGDYCNRKPAVRIELEKVIPIGGGLGGGSSDAAATLRICNDLWRAGLDRTELAEIGARIGSDVPLFFSLPAAVMTGRGDRVEPVRLCWSGWVLLVFAGPKVSTVEVYRTWRRSDAAHLPCGTDEAIRGATSAAELSGLLTNHLEPAVFRVSPAVARVYDELEHLGFGPVRVSGAGSTLYRLFDEEESARRVAKEIEDQGMKVTTAVVAAPAEESPVVSKEN